MELRHLRYFVAVAEERHFGRAAARLHMAQPPLSQQIRQLEAELGLTLLTRTTRRVDLTPAGAAYLDRAREILGAVDDAAHEAASIASGRRGRLLIGCVGSATYSLLPDLARTLRAELPEVEFGFRGEMLSPDQATALLDGSLDLGLMRPLADTAGLSVTTLRQEKLLVALPRDHRFARRRRIRVADLDGEPLVIHAGSGRSAMNTMIQELFDSAGLRADIAHEVAETSTLVTFVAAGLGVAITPEPSAALAVPGVVYLPLTGTPGIELVAATRAGDESPLITRALAVLADLGADQPPRH
ncbi:DNA-binding transcriptional LysR family regulator [Nocardioides luteus]|uniref:LysR family transcriptional regulator n=1 Tax=Nocardioides luteus TaxID=1844 RepID=A0ABQ5SWY6_9ACTN|nr:LysR substrate-binding domain-containing protein [Nocardioides luteus]MDR7311850.1 DNA-binding transcriptional LysR family regulator [Nocardioides luteus]GGR66754.1 LysR family transcriptional regulator [Nocardioides luteus]GLJ68093.1 LysR family transcriptional regulator [Nocardioides luteus]